MGLLKRRAALIALVTSCIGMTVVPNPNDCSAQDLSTRFGFGAGLVINPSNPSISTDDLGIDLRGRISKPVGARASIAADVSTFLFSADESTEFVLNPQVSVIVTLDGERRFPYLVFGVGALLPTEQGRSGQLTIQGAYGWAWPFGDGTSAFAELNPMIAFKDEGIALLFPLRGGLIF